MSRAGSLTRSVLLASVMGAAVVPCPTLAADDVVAAGDGRALQALLDKSPDARDAVQKRAQELKLEVLPVSVGAKGAEKTELFVAGGAKGFRDCAQGEVCPEMLVVPHSPAGFKIGSPDSEEHHTDDEAQVEVSIPAFAMGATEVTVAEYQACVDAGGCKPPEWLEPGGQHNIKTGASRYYANLGDNLTGAEQPIVGVSFIDATAYAAWLSQKTGHRYSLPSEAQWEFAARAGTTTAYWWGDAMPSGGDARAACVGCGSQWDGKSPGPARAFSPNPWGLFNVHGNVWEWTADFYCDDYASGPKDGSARVTDDCPKRGDEPPARGVHSLRGGSSFYPAKLMRSAMRARNVPDFRNFSVGFRVARALEP